MSQHYTFVNRLLWGIALLIAYLVLSEIASQAGTSALGLLSHALESMGAMMIILPAGNVIRRKRVRYAKVGDVVVVPLGMYLPHAVLVEKVYVGEFNQLCADGITIKLDDCSTYRLGEHVSVCLAIVSDSYRARHTVRATEYIDGYTGEVLDDESRIAFFLSFPDTRINGRELYIPIHEHMEDYCDCRVCHAEATK